MGVVHFLDVGNGDCSIIEHASGRVTVIDVCHARSPRPLGVRSIKSLADLAEPSSTGYESALANPSRSPTTSRLADLFAELTSPPVPPGGFGTLADLLRNPLAPTPPTGGTSSRSGLDVVWPPSSSSAAGSLGDLFGLSSITPVNPIEYLRAQKITQVFRFILSHPDMDHMDGIADLFAEFSPDNFWDTDNNCEKTVFKGGRYRQEDWEFYTGLREFSSDLNTRRLVLYANAKGSYFNQADNCGEPHDGLHVLAPTRQLVMRANRSGDFNDASYVILYVSKAGRVLFCGDSHDHTWDHLLSNHLPDIKNVELMIAPHHGRDSDRDREFLSKVRPKFTLFGKARSQHLAYDAWRNRGLPFITSTQSGTIVIDTNAWPMGIYVQSERFARSTNPNTFYSDFHGAWHLGSVK